MSYRRILSTIRKLSSMRRFSLVVGAALAAAYLYSRIPVGGTDQDRPVSGVALERRASPEPSDEAASTTGPRAASAKESQAASAESSDSNRSRLSLTGVLVGAGEAIIVAGDGGESTYRVGELIETSGRTVLLSVHSDYVLVDRDGSVQRLPLDPPPHRPEAAARDLAEDVLIVDGSAEQLDESRGRASGESIDILAAPADDSSAPAYRQTAHIVTQAEASSIAASAGSSGTARIIAGPDDVAPDAGSSGPVREIDSDF